MIDSGTLSAYSAYTGASTSVYSSPSLKPIEKNEDVISVAKNSDNSTYPEIKDEAIISDEAQNLLASEKTETKEKTEDKTGSDEKTAQASDELTAEEKQQIAELKARDAEVKAHEHAHIAAAAGINASAPSYTYQTGPDGKNYAIGGEVAISFSKSGDPATDIANAQTMKAAALAPAEPSAQDYAVARNADKLISNARKEQAQKQAQELEQNNKPAEDGNAPTAQVNETTDTPDLTPSMTNVTVAEESSGVPRMT